MKLLIWNLALLASFHLPAHAAEPDHHHHDEDMDMDMDMDDMPEMHHHGMAHASQPTGPADCGESEVWDVGMGMCMPLPSPKMRMLMIHGNAFGVFTSSQGPRGRTAFAAPNMFMADFGATVGTHHYLNLDFMGTFERWTFPTAGYPLLMQIGEDDAQGNPYIDAQHPHSSPIMGLTLSDTIYWGSAKDHLKVYFAPRGEDTEGPVAFMHRPTGMVNPDAPLGHHIGQDVGHISSTVFGAALKLGNTRMEASAFHGEEPSPTKIDLPLGTPDSAAVRVIEEFTPTFMAMVSYAYVNRPEPNDPSVVFEERFSASAYNQFSLGEHYTLYNTLIAGAVTHYDNASMLTSFGEEFWLRRNHCNLWGRIEWLQRTPAELNVTVASGPNDGRWVAAATIGYTQTLTNWNGLVVGVGGSVTANFIPAELAGAYGGNPWAAKVFLQVGGMRMWMLGPVKE